MYINLKGKNQYNVDNLSNFIFISNHNYSLYLEKGDKRYFCLEVNEKYLQNDTYFKILTNFN